MAQTSNSGENDNVMRFAKYTIDQLNRRSEVGLYSRVDLSVYGARSKHIVGPMQDLTKNQISDILDEFHTDVAISTTLSTLSGALVDVRMRLRTRIEQRMQGTRVRRQVVIVFKHGAVDDDEVQKSRDILLWFMDHAVHVLVVGKCL